MIKLVLTDLDGTFLNKKGSFDQTYYEKIKTIMDQNNIAFAPCTGKQCERVEELFDTDISDNIWILGDSATRIKHKGKYIYESLLPNKLGIQIVEKTRRNSVRSYYYCLHANSCLHQVNSVRRGYSKGKKIIRSC